MLGYGGLEYLPRKYFKGQRGAGCLCDPHDHLLGEPWFAPFDVEFDAKIEGTDRLCFVN